MTDGKCWWSKTYLARHDISYTGFNEGKGIWGTWVYNETIRPGWRGGFHIWPAAMGDPTQQTLAEALDLPAFDDLTVETVEGRGARSASGLRDRASVATAVPNPEARP